MDHRLVESDRLGDVDTDARKEPGAGFRVAIQLLSDSLRSGLGGDKIRIDSMGTKYHSLCVEYAGYPMLGLRADAMVVPLPTTGNLCEQDECYSLNRGLGSIILKSSWPVANQ